MDDVCILHRRTADGQRQNAGLRASASASGPIWLFRIPPVSATGSSSACSSPKPDPLCSPACLHHTSGSPPCASSGTQTAVFTGAQQPGQRLRIAAVGFTRSFGRRGIEDGEIVDAVDPETLQKAVDHELHAGLRSRPSASRRPLPMLASAPCATPQSLVTRPKELDFTIATAIGDSNRYRVPMHTGNIN